MKVYELQGVNFENKGAEMMLRATAQHFSDHKKVKLALPFRIGSRVQREEAGLDHLLFLHREPRFANTVLNCAASVLRKLPGHARRYHGSWGMMGLIDAAGFLYSEQWGLEGLELQAQKVRRFRSANKLVVFLPQAFGPFESRRAKECAAAIVENSDLIFARDATSYMHLARAAGELPQLRQAPDFTNLLPPRFADPIGDDVVFIVPNARMIDKSTEEVAKQYISCLGHAVASVRNVGLQPVIMVHDAIGDRAIAHDVRQMTGEAVREMTHSDPLVLKGWLAQARGVVGSRFHALVSALSSGTPAISLGWSHKYGELMADYGLESYNLTPGDLGRIDEAIQLWSDQGVSAPLRQQIVARSKAIKRDVSAMWGQVDEVLAKYLK